MDFTVLSQSKVQTCVENSNRPTTTLYYATRWWSRYEVIAQVHNAFGDIFTFLQNADLPSTTTNKMLEIINNPGLCRKLKMELAVTMDSMERFVKSTYILKGDGPLALEAYEHIRALSIAISTDHYPNVTAVAKQLSEGDSSHEQQLLRYVKACTEAAYAYFKTTFEGDLKSAVEAFKAARYFSPFRVSQSCPVTADIESLHSFPFLNSSDVIENLMVCQIRLTFYSGGNRRKRNYQTAKLVLLVQPSSEAAERVFSIRSLIDRFLH